MVDTQIVKYFNRALVISVYDWSIEGGLGGENSILNSFSDDTVRQFFLYNLL